MRTTRTNTPPIVLSNNYVLADQQHIHTHAHILRAALISNIMFGVMQTTEGVAWVDNGGRELLPGMRPIFVFAANVPFSDDTIGCVCMYLSLCGLSQDGPLFVLTWLGRVEMLSMHVK